MTIVRENAQSGGSRDVYHGRVDNSNYIVTFGDDGQIEGIRVIINHAPVYNIKSK